MKTNKLRDLTNDELIRKADQFKEELFNLRFQMATGQLENPVRIKEVRRGIARAKTILRERELQEQKA